MRRGKGARTGGGGARESAKEGGGGVLKLLKISSFAVARQQYSKGHIRER